MEFKEYKSIYNRLSGPSDIEDLMKEGYDKELLTVLFTQKTTRETKKRFHIVKQNAPRILRDWKKGKSLLELSKQWNFPPVLTAMMIFLEDGASKKEFWTYIRDPETLGNEEVANEVREIVAADIVYSPEADEGHKKRGLWGESLLQNWLNEQAIEYRTENDLRGTHEKTPDCLLKEPMYYNGKKIYWIESKATFGDNTEFRFNSRKQLIPYTQLFGPGVVVYWMGCLDDLELPEDIYLTDISILERKLSKTEDE